MVENILTRPACKRVLLNNSVLNNCFIYVPLVLAWNQPIRKPGFQMTHFQLGAQDIEGRDRDRGETRANDFSCDEAEHGICGSENTEQCTNCGRWVCEDHRDEHAAEHVQPTEEAASINRKRAEAFLESQRAAKAERQAEIDGLYASKQQKEVA
jgi:hypothetical protein